VRIAVLGPGGVGGLVAAALARAGEDVLVIAREGTAELIASGGISVDSERLGQFTARPAVEATLREPGAVLIVATKATGLQAALGRVRETPALVVPLLNGLDHLARLRAQFGPERVAAGVIRVESDCPAPGQVVQSSPFLRVDLASERDELRPLLGDLAARLEAAGIPTVIEASEAQVMWSKLVRLNALALTTSASGRDLGEIRKDPRWRSALERAVAETAAVAVADGAHVDPADTMAELEQAHPELRSSMHRDLQAGRTPELDAIAGAVLRGAARHGIPCPGVAYLSRRVAQRAGIPAPATG
jgi:2-dehydropantoate 2-reductase